MVIKCIRRAKFLFIFVAFSLSCARFIFFSLFLLPSSPCLHHWQPPITPIIHFTLLSRQSSPSPSFSSSERQHHRHHQIFLQWFLSLMCSCGCCGYSCCQRRCCLLLHHQHDEAAIADHWLSFSSSSRRCCLFSSAVELLQVTVSSSLFSFDCLNWSSRSSSSSVPSLLTAAPSSLLFCPLHFRSASPAYFSSFRYHRSRSGSSPIATIYSLQRSASIIIDLHLLQLTVCAASALWLLSLLPESERELLLLLAGSDVVVTVVFSG